jgi:hypothetical protein
LMLVSLCVQLKKLGVLTRAKKKTPPHHTKNPAKMPPVMSRPRALAVVAAGAAGILAAYRVYKTMAGGRSKPSRRDTSSAAAPVAEAAQGKPRSENHLKRILRILIPALNHSSTCVHTLAGVVCFPVCWYE